MIISQNRSPSPDEFERLIADTTTLLNSEAFENTGYFIKRNAQLLEEDVYKALVSSAKNTKFDDTIRIISGQRFPDIVAAKYYGVEVKSSKDDKWVSLGGSVNESTRVSGVERIYITFGKLADPVEFRSRPYEDCLSEIIATHYPRYRIDMKLKKGETIFDKMKISYDDLRKTGNVVGEVVKYYKGQLKRGESLWWIDSNDMVETNVTASMKVRLWSSLSKQEKDKLTVSIIVFFPEIFSSSQRKYERAVLWLASRHGVVSTSMRDIFSAGGTEAIITKNETFEDMPQIFGHIRDYADDIRLQANLAHESILREMWKASSIDESRVSQWIDIVSNGCALKNCDSNQCKRVLSSLFLYNEWE